MITTLLLAITLITADSTIQPTDDASTVFRITNLYRERAGVGKVDMDNSLNYLAYLHCLDLVNNYDTSSSCWLISWSKSSRYSYGCVTDDSTSLDIMYRKPKEILNMKGRGYEMVVMADVDLDISKTLNLINSNKFYRDMRIDKRFKRVGIYIYKNVCSVWFVDK